MRRLKAGLQTAAVRSTGFSLCPTRVDYSNGSCAAWRRDYKPRTSRNSFCAALH